jgi:hypothetical protein
LSDYYFWDIDIADLKQVRELIFFSEVKKYIYLLFTETDSSFGGSICILKFCALFFSFLFLLYLRFSAISPNKKHMTSCNITKRNIAQRRSSVSFRVVAFISTNLHFSSTSHIFLLISFSNFRLYGPFFPFFDHLFVLFVEGIMITM